MAIATAGSQFMKIALFDFKVVSTNPIGSCHLRMLQAG